MRTIQAKNMKKTKYIKGTCKNCENKINIKYKYKNKKQNANICIEEYEINGLD